MFLRIENLPPTRLLGVKIRTSIAQNQSFQLWNAFMPRLSEIKQRVNTHLVSMQQFDSGQEFSNFTPQTLFTKWAAVEEMDFNTIPENMQQHLLEGGLYAVFLHKGTPTQFAITQHFIYNQWLPASPYEVDEREHFEVMGDKYRINSQDSEEEIWVPVKKRQYT